MPYLTLTLSGLPVDLPPDAQVALSYRANDLRTLDSREGSFSESFTLPRTARNAHVLGSPHVLDSLTDAPYHLLPAVLTAPGGTELLRGFAVLERAEAGYEVTLTDALGGLFAAVGDRALRALDLRAFDHEYSIATTLVAQGRGYTEGYTYPLADTGLLALRDAVADGVRWYELPHAVYYHAVLTALVAQALPGYRLTGSLLDEDLYRTAVLPRATPYPTTRLSARLPYAVAVRSLGETIERAPHDGEIYALLPFLLQDTGPAAGWTNYTTYHTPPFPADIHVTARLLVRLDATNATDAFRPCVAAVRVVDTADPTGNYLQQQVLVESIGSFFALTAAEQPTGYRVVSFDFTLPANAASHALAVQVHLSGGAGLRIGTGSSISFAVGERAYPTGPVHLDASLPDVSQADFLTLLVNQFNVLIQADAATKTVRFDLFNDLERHRRRAVDWSEKVDFTGPPATTFRLGNYAQANRFAYDTAPKEYDELLLGTGPDLGTGAAVLAVPNTTLPRSADAYAAGVVLPLPHATLNGAGSLLYLPQLAYPDPLHPPGFFNAARSYVSTDGPVQYGGQLWQCVLNTLLRTTPGTPPRPGFVPVQVVLVGTPLPAAAPAWQRVDTAGGTDALNTVARVVPAPLLPGLHIREDAPGTAAYFPAVALTRAGLPFTDLLPAYHEGLRRLLHRCRVLRVNLRLTPVDIAGLDFAVPVWLDVPHVPGYGAVKGLFYLNNIDQFQPASVGPVAVELVLLGDAVPGLAPNANVPVTPLTPPAENALLLETGEPFLLETGAALLLS